MEATHHIEITIDCNDETTRAMLIARLSDIGYDGFEETDNQLKAYIDAAVYDAEEVAQIVKEYSLNYIQSRIEKQNWNALWEADFEPVRVDDFVGIRAAFHPPFTDVTYDLVITPKMSFGTGHHATTWQVMKLMSKLDFSGKTVFDFGTGTGILAILAAKMGAGRVLGVDNDDWCIENATENTVINETANVQIKKLDAVDAVGEFDIVIANINRNIILDNLQPLALAVKKGGVLLLSGLLTTDEAEIVAAFTQQGLAHAETTERKGWIAICMRKNERS